MSALTAWQRVALENFTLLAEEQARPLFRHLTRLGTLNITVRAGWG